MAKVNLATKKFLPLFSNNQERYEHKKMTVKLAHMGKTLLSSQSADFEVRLSNKFPIKKHKNKNFNYPQFTKVKSEWKQGLPKKLCVANARKNAIYQTQKLYNSRFLQ